MTKVCVYEKRARHGRTNAELFPSSSFYRSIYPRFNSTGTTTFCLTRWKSFIYTRHGCDFLFLHQKFYPPLYSRTGFCARVRDKRTRGASRLIWEKKGALLLQIGRYLVDRRDLSVLSAEIYPVFL